MFSVMSVTPLTVATPTFGFAVGCVGSGIVLRIGARAGATVARNCCEGTVPVCVAPRMVQIRLVPSLLLRQSRSARRSPVKSPARCTVVCCSRFQLGSASNGRSAPPIPASPR